MNVKYHSIKDVASITGKSYSWVYNKVKAGELPVRKLGNKFVATKGSVDKFVRNLSG